MRNKSRDDIHGREVVVVHVVQGAVLVFLHGADVGDVVECGVKDPVKLEGEVKCAIDRDGAKEIVDEVGLLHGEGVSVLLL